MPPPAQAAAVDRELLSASALPAPNLPHVSSLRSIEPLPLVPAGFLNTAGSASNSPTANGPAAHHQSRSTAVFSDVDLTDQSPRALATSGRVASDGNVASGAPRPLGTVTKSGAVSDEFGSAKGLVGSSSSSVPPSGPPPESWREFWTSFFASWRAESHRNNYYVGLYLFYLFLDVSDMLLSLVYLASYNVGCYALVTIFHGGVPFAQTMFYLAFLATILAAISVHTQFSTLVDALAENNQHPYAAMLVVARRDWADMASPEITRTKLHALINLLFRDSLMTMIVLANLGPNDNNTIMALKLVISAVSLARNGTHLFLIVLCRMTVSACCGARAFHRHPVFLAIKTVVTSVSFLAWLAIPLAFFHYPDLARYIYVTETSVTQARLMALCAPPTPAQVSASGGNPMRIPNFCNPSVCLTTYGTVTNYTAWSLTGQDWITVPEAYICSVKNLPVSRVDTHRYALRIRGLPELVTYDALVPCVRPRAASGALLAASGITNSTPSAALWTQHLSVPYVTSPRTPRTARAPLRRANPLVYAHDYSADFGTRVLPHQYAARDVVPRTAQCTRRYALYTSFYGLLDLEQARVLVPEEVNVRNQNYLAAIEVDQADTADGPLSCSFDYVGFVQQSVVGAEGYREQWAAWTRSVGAWIQGWGVGWVRA
ncbi:hypothetical protein AMAG_08663 [Allomyces macrogynus ATCC 38327]|uniref:Uncharacterized protein n=1 Tax=Allomyces macrogynus (strain ATCC 38327) TaxID=578462 RepID=A0A0L0SM67_ALLM3|nr:hypothetical protein AMAG_08663 [Allomyces macrogynus ATCC 38327]|eukprot:KNE63553.1 hypothetical protein AMAG_08663 [Allomyces macrogynus ATCC 38327]